MPKNDKATSIPLTKEQKAERERIRKQKEREAAIEATRINKLPPRKKAFFTMTYDLGPAEEWQHAFRLNKDLVHLDISYNDFDSKEIEIFKKGLDVNHTIFGIHFAGNEGVIDNNGYVNFFDHDQQNQ